MFVLKRCRQFQSALSHKGYTLRTKRREDNDLKLRNEIDGNDVFYDNSPEKGLKKNDCMSHSDTKATRQPGKKSSHFIFCISLDKRRGNIYANKKRGLLVN